MSQTKVQLVSDGAVIGIQSAGTVIGSGATTLNFVGAGNTFAYNAGTKTLDISISGGSGGGGIGTVINYDDGKASPFSFIDAEVTITSNLNLDTTNAGASQSYIVSAVPKITVASGVAVTVGSGKTMVIDVLQIGDL